MNAGIAGPQNLAAVFAGTAPPIGDDASSALNDRIERRCIPALEARLHDEIDEAERQRDEQITVAAKAGHPHRLLDARERIAFLWGEIGIGMRRAQNGFREIGASAHP